MRTLVLPQFDGPQMIVRISTRQHFAVLVLLRADSHYSRFRVTICNVYR